MHVIAQVQIELEQSVMTEPVLHLLVPEHALETEVLTTGSVTNLEDMIQVVNCSGTAHEKCSCGSWIQHWFNASHVKPTRCSSLGCFVRDVEGAHVRRYGSLDLTHYIVPLCHGCNVSDQKITLRDDAILVPARELDTCKRPL
jgi:hypothetical protein